MLLRFAGHGSYQAPVNTSASIKMFPCDLSLKHFNPGSIFLCLACVDVEEEQGRSTRCCHTGKLSSFFRLFPQAWWLLFLGSGNSINNYNYFMTYSCLCYQRWHFERPVYIMPHMKFSNIRNKTSVYIVQRKD